jgi:KDO2-lipid IV(A) lauroyltransferase
MARPVKNPFRRRIERLAARCVAAVVYVVMRLIPLRWCRAVGNLGGYALYAVSLRRQRLADDNLVATFGDRYSPAERKAIRLTVAKNMTKLFVELFKLPTLGRDAIVRLMPAEGVENMRKALARGKGAILVSAHYGNWEVAAARVAAEGFDVAVVARDASDAQVASIINASRQALGIRVLSRSDPRGMIAHLRSNGVLAILPDQHSSEHPVRVTFLGRPAWCARGPATLALRTGCAVVPGFGVREPGDKLRGYILEEIPLPETADRDRAVAELMQRIYDVIGEQIMARPEQWLWLHNRWKEYTPEKLQPSEAG